MKVILVLMQLMSLLAGVPVIGKGWWGIAQIEFLILPISLYNHPKPLNLSLYLILLCCHLVILAMPFIRNWKTFSQLLVWSPLIYLVIFGILGGPLALLCAPFALVWIIALIVFFRNRLSNI